MSAPAISMNVVIHRAFRRHLQRLHDALQAFPDGDRARAAALERAWDNFEVQLHEHHEGEHETVFPALAEVGVPGPALATFETEHQAMAADLTAASIAMRRLSGSADRADADAAAVAVQQLQATTVTHLDHEEQETEGPLVEHHADPTIQQMVKTMRGKLGPVKAGFFVTWLQDGATAQERAALRETIPGPVVTVLGGVFGRRYRREIAPTWAGAGRTSG